MHRLAVIREWQRKDEEARRVHFQAAAVTDPVQEAVGGAVAPTACGHAVAEDRAERGQASPGRAALAIYGVTTLARLPANG